MWLVGSPLDGRSDIRALSLVSVRRHSGGRGIPSFRPSSPLSDGSPSRGSERRPNLLRHDTEQILFAAMGKSFEVDASHGDEPTAVRSLSVRKSFSIPNGDYLLVAPPRSPLYELQCRPEFNGNDTVTLYNSNLYNSEIELHNYMRIYNCIDFVYV